MDKSTPCPVCGGKSYISLFSAVDRLVSQTSFDIKKCEDCGLVITSDPPEENEAGRYYMSGDYISHSDKRENIKDLLYHIARRFMLGKKRHVVSGSTGIRRGSLLDIGSGTGYFAGEMISAGWKVTGIEINGPAREFSQEHFRLNALRPDELVNISDDSADCVTYWHVLEHLYNPDHWLKHTSRILKTNGICVIAVPNINSGDAHHFGNNWAALDVPRHLWHFSEETLTRLVSKHGFSCRKIKGMPLDIFYISVLSYERMNKKMPLLKGLLTALWLTVTGLFKRNSSSSLIYILERAG